MTEVLKIALFVVVAIVDATSSKDSRYENLAYKRTTSQSGEKSDAKLEDWGSSLKAVDGNDNPLFEGKSCTHTDELMNPYWRVQIGGHGRPLNVPVRYVMITNRNGASERLNNFVVNVIKDGSDKRHLCYHFEGKFPPGTRLLKCKEGTPAGSVVEIKLLRDKKESLTLCEVAVFGENPGWYKPGTEEIESPVDVDYRGRKCASRDGKYCRLEANGNKLDRPKCFVGDSLQACTIPPYFDDFEYTTEWSDWSPCSKTCGHSTRRRQKMCEEPEFIGTPCPKTFLAEIQSDVCETQTCNSEMGKGDGASGVGAGQITKLNSEAMPEQPSSALGAVPAGANLLSRRLQAAPASPTEKASYAGVVDVNEQGGDERPPAAQANVGFIESAGRSGLESVTGLGKPDHARPHTSVNEVSGLSVSGALVGFRVPGSLTTIQKVMLAMVSLTPFTLLLGLLGCICYLVDKNKRRRIPSTDGEEVGLLEEYPDDFDDKRISFRSNRKSDAFKESEFPSDDDFGGRKTKKKRKKSKGKNRASQQDDAVLEGEDEFFDAQEELPLPEGEDETVGEDEVEGEGEAGDEDEDLQDEVASNEPEESVVVENQNARSRPSQVQVNNRNENSASRARIPVRSHESGARRNDRKGPLEHLVDKVIQNAVLSEEKQNRREKRTGENGVYKSKRTIAPNIAVTKEVSRLESGLTRRAPEQKNVSEKNHTRAIPSDKRSNPPMHGKAVSVGETHTESLKLNIDKHSGLNTEGHDKGKYERNAPTVSSANNDRVGGLNNVQTAQKTSHKESNQQGLKPDSKHIESLPERQGPRTQSPRAPSTKENRPEKERMRPPESQLSASREDKHYASQKRSETSEMPLQSRQSNRDKQTTPPKDALPRRRKSPGKPARKSPTKDGRRSRSKEVGRRYKKRSPESASAQDLPGYGASAWIIDSKRTPSNDEKYFIPGYGHQNV